MERNRSAGRNESPNRAREAQSSIEVRGNRSSGGRIERDRSRDTQTRETYRERSTSSNRGSGGRIERDPNRDSRNSDSRTYRDGSRDRSRNNGNWRNDSRSGSYRDGRYRDNRYRNDGRYGRYGNRAPFRHSGRVHRVYPYGGGYRVWLTGCNYPFYVPSAYYHRSRFRVGLTVVLGGYYNSRGYYDYYDGYDDRYYDARTSRGELRGVVESVDYRRETFVVRNEATGSFVTVIMRDRGRDPVRAGDYVELGGDWTRSGLFEAYRVDIVDSDRYR